MAKDTELTILSENGTQQLAAVNYSSLSEEQFEALIKDAKGMSEKHAGLPTADSIDYFSIEEELKIGEKIRFKYVARGIEDRVDEETGESRPTPTVFLINEQGKFYKCSTFKIVQHFALQQSGYAAEVTYTGSRKSKKNRQRTIQTMEFRPLT